MSCKHKTMISTARRDFCPECGYEFHYGDAHATGEAQLSKLINPGQDAQANGWSEEEYHHHYDEDLHDHWIDYGGEG